MSFVKPALLWGWVVLGLLAVGVIAYSLRADTRLRTWIKPEHWARVLPGYFPQGRLVRRVLLLLALAAALGALARPQWGERVEIASVTGMDLMVVLDLSNSMEVEDLSPSRLSRAKHWLRTFIAGLDGDRVGVVGFGSSAHVFVPLTQDLAFVQDQLQSLTPKMITNQGTDVGLALEVAAATLERGSENEVRPGGEDQSASHALILITDGEDHEGAAAEVAKKLKGMGVELYILGVGTERGGPVPVIDDSGQKVTYKKDRAGQPVVSRFSGKSLQEVASAAGGAYWNLTADEAEVTELLQRIGKLERGEIAEKKVVLKEDRYQWPLALAIALLLAEFFVPLHRKVRAGVVGVFLAILASANAHAGPVGDLRGYWDNRTGLRALEEGRVDDAERSFRDASEQSPTRGEPSFNRGVSRLKKGDADGALEAFAESAERGGDPRTQGTARFNEGWVRAEKKDWLGAARAYVDAIQHAKKSGDHELEERARKNLELLQQQQQEEEKKKSENKEKSEGDKKDQKDQGSSSDQKDESGKEGESEKESQADKKSGPSGMKHKRSQFKSEKLKAEDAERVLNELQGKEKELRGKLRKQTRKTQTTVQDW